MKTQYSNRKPDKAGSRAARTAQFAAMLIAWRKRKGLNHEEAARILCCTERTFKSWEAGESVPRGVTLTAIVAAIKGGSI